MSHQTFYRKYRSQVFDEIVGQAHIVQTLKNAMQFDRLAHAYIFSGPRGTGKTSTARILAKSLNCRNPKDHEPCLTCDLCQKIAKGQSVDIIEMDAASNTGVDHIRVLNDQANFAPVECPYRMFIIDEAHMLSTGAFNALLKTLEEPPANTIFILATTEPHKIPVTIHSRCQHLQFKKMPLEDMVKHLQFVAESEHITIPENSLHTIARSASGCMRDGLSLLEQIYAFKGKTIAHEDVISILGSASFDALCNLMTHFLQGRHDATMSAINTMSEEGINMMQFAGDLTQFLKQLLFVKMDLGHTIDLDESRMATLKDLATSGTFDQLRHLLETFAKTEMDLRWFPNPELLIQIRFLSTLSAEASAKADTPVQSTTPISQPAPAPKKDASAVASAKADTPAPSAPTMSQPTPPPPVAPAKAEPTTPAPTPAPTPDAPSGAPTWDTFLKHLETANRGYHSLLKYSFLIQLNDTQAIAKLKHDNAFARDKLTDEKGLTVLNQALQDVYGKPLNFILVGANDTVPTDSAAGTDNAVTPAPTIQFSEAPPKESQQINTIVAMFEGQVIT